MGVPIANWSAHKAAVGSLYEVKYIVTVNETANLPALSQALTKSGVKVESARWIVTDRVAAVQLRMQRELALKDVISDPLTVQQGGRTVLYALSLVELLTPSTSIAPSTVPTPTTQEAGMMAQVRAWFAGVGRETSETVKAGADAVQAAFRGVGAAAEGVGTGAGDASRGAGSLLRNLPLILLAGFALIILFRADISKLAKKF